jgi:hypothetical protein
MEQTATSNARRGRGRPSSWTVSTSCAHVYASMPDAGTSLRWCPSATAIESPRKLAGLMAVQCNSTTLQPQQRSPRFSKQAGDEEKTRTLRDAISCNRRARSHRQCPLFLRFRATIIWLLPAMKRRWRAEKVAAQSVRSTLDSRHSCAGWIERLTLGQAQISPIAKGNSDLSIWSMAS